MSDAGHDTVIPLELGEETARLIVRAFDPDRPARHD
jgi:hypothetical protein